MTNALHKPTSIEIGTNVSTEQTPSTVINPESGPQTAGDLLVSYLEALGVEYVFGIPGGAIEPLYNALARSSRRGGPSPVLARHETGAAFMADGYSRNAGCIGVCCGTTGPGSTNLITGVASAYENNIPMLVITAQSSLNQFGLKPFQESTDTGVNIVGMFQYCTGYNTMVSHIEQFEHKLATALMTAINNSCPVHLNIPPDIMSSPLPSKQPTFDLKSLVQPARLQDQDAVEQLCAELSEAKNPVFVLGAGCHDAVPMILRIAFRLKARIVTTPDGKGLVSPYHPLYRGVIGFAGHELAEQTLTDPEVDLVVAAGVTFGEFNSNAWDRGALLNNRLIHIEAVDKNLTRTPMARLHVRGKIASVFESVSEYLEADGDELDVDSITRELEARAEKETRQDGYPSIHYDLDGHCEEGWEQALVKPQWLMAYLTTLFPAHTIYHSDAGNSLAWSIHYLHPFDRRVMERRHGEKGQHRVEAGRRTNYAGLYQTTTEFASMGWAIGAAVGTSLAAPERPSVCITGDGCYLMSGQEITVAQQHKLPVVFIILNDSGMGMVKHGQIMNGAESIAWELPQVDFAAMAASMGIRGHVIESPRDLLNLSFEEICPGDGPTLLDVRIDPDQVPPMGMRLKALGRAD